jgi:hypothetical protein
MDTQFQQEARLFSLQPGFSQLDAAPVTAKECDGPMPATGTDSTRDGIACSWLRRAETAIEEHE